MAKKDKDYEDDMASITGVGLPSSDEMSKLSGVLSRRSEEMATRRKKSEEERKARKASLQEKAKSITEKYAQGKETAEDYAKLNTYLVDYKKKMDERDERDSVPKPSRLAVFRGLDARGSGLSKEASSESDSDVISGRVSDKPAVFEDLTFKQDAFKNLKSLSKRGALTPEIYNQAKDTLKKYEGVSEEAFESTMAKNRISPSFQSTSPSPSPSPSSPSLPEPTNPKEAAQNYAYQREFGTGMDAYKAMQDPMREFGSGGPLGKNQSTPLYKREKGDPSIMDPVTKGQRMLAQMSAGKLLREKEELTAKQRKKLDKLLTKRDGAVKKPKSMAEENEERRQERNRRNNTKD